MTRIKSIIGALALCAVSLCAFAAVSASASELTAVECLEKGVGSKYNTSQCVTPATAGNFETAAIALNTPTEVTATSTEIEPALRATLGGVAVTIKCELSHVIEGKVTNKETSAGKHEIESTASRYTYTNCKAVVKANEARNCLVEGVTGPEPMIGMISTVGLKGLTTGVEHKVKVSPAEGEVFTKFNILNKAKGGVECPFNADVPVEVKGSVEGEASTEKHSHLTFNEGNNGTALKANGGAATYLDTVGGTAVKTGAVVGAETFT